MPEHPYPVGTRVYHYGQQWYRPHMGGTGTVQAVDGPYHDGTYEYDVRAGIYFSRRTGEDNPEIRMTRWSSLAIRYAESDR